MAKKKRRTLKKEKFVFVLNQIGFEDDELSEEPLDEFF
jgi:hypothetical protein